MDTDEIDAESNSSLSTKITVIVFWGLVIIGLSFSGILLHHIKENTLENRQLIADSIAYNVESIVNSVDTTSHLSGQEVTEKLNHILSTYENIKIELRLNSKLINYAENNFQS